MIQTSTRGQKRRIARKRQVAATPARYNETHPEGNRLTRRKQARFDRTIMQTLRKEGFQRHLFNLRKAAVAGYKIRMERIAKRKLAAAHG